MGVCNCSAIILMEKKELVALLSLSSCCLVMVVWLFLGVPWVCLQFVVVVFPDHTHLLFFGNGFVQFINIENPFRIEKVKEILTIYIVIIHII